MTAAKGKLLFSFGVITDTHVRAPEGDLSSPYPVNELANDRAKFAVSVLAQEFADFCFHLGDMVHPLPGMPAYDSACSTAIEILSPLQPNLYFVPGNHDIGDKPMPGLPAAAVSDSAVQDYRRHFGKDYYCFEHSDCLFVVLNSSLINCDQLLQQTAWLEATLQQNKCDRVFLLLHYPPFIHSEAEDEHYDNLAEPGRSWLINLIREHAVEMVLSGHVHHHFYNRIGSCKCYTLSPTSFTRQDYAEIFKTVPAAEYGRDDLGKYGVSVIDVFEIGNRLRFIPTYGAQKAGPGTSRSASRDTETPLTVPLRHAWHESIDLPYNGPMEEFSRKRCRNDYVFLRLRQMGIKDVRVPIDDVIDPVSRSRVADYVADGFRFHAFCPGYLLEKKIEQAKEGLALLSTLECVAADSIESIEEPSAVVSGLPLIVGYALTGAHRSNTGKPFAHSVSSGFLWQDQEKVLSVLSAWSKPVYGVVFQIPWEQDVAVTLVEMQSRFASLAYKCIACVRMAKSSPAAENFDDEAIQARIQQALQCAESLPAVELQLDTSMDVDRGYSPRHGLFDRLTNLRAAGIALSDSPSK